MRTTEQPEALLQSSLKKTKLGVWTIDLISDEVSADTCCRQILGMGPLDPVSLETAIDLIHPDDRAQALRVFEQATNPLGAGQYRMERRILWPDSSVCWVGTRGQAIFAGEGVERRAVGLVEVVIDVTPRKCAEAQHRLQTEMLDQIQEAVIAVDNEERILYLNAAAATEYEIEVTAALGRKLSDVYQDLWRSPAEKERACAALAETGHWHGQNIHIKRDGEIIHVESTVNVLRDERGNTSGMVAILRNMTEQKEMEQALQAGEQLRSAVEAASIIVAHVDRNLRYTWIHNPHPDFDPDEVLGKRDDELLPTAEGKALTQLKQEALTRGMGMRREITLPVSDGPRTYDVVLEPQRNAQGEPVGLTTVALDVTERKRQETKRDRLYRQVVDERSRLEAVLQNIPAGVLIIEAPSGRLILGNAQVKEIWRHSHMPSDAAAAQALYRGFHPDGSPYQLQEWPLFRAMAAGETVHKEEIEILRGDGTRGTLLVSATPIRDEDGNMVAVSVFHDISERKEAEEALRQIQTELEQRVAARTQALAQANARLQREIEEHKRAEAELGEVRRLISRSREAERVHLARELHDGPMQDLTAMDFALFELAEQLSVEDVAAVSTEIQTLRKRLVQINQTLREMANDLRPPILAHAGLQAALRSQVAQFKKRYATPRVMLSLPDRAEPLPEASQLALYRICQQALHNIQQHAQAEKVWIRLACEPAQIVLEIQDDGRGFEVPDRWMELARQGHLGLVGMAERADHVGGHLTLESQPGHGTTVCVVVPRTGNPPAD